MARRRQSSITTVTKYALEKINKEIAIFYGDSKKRYKIHYFFDRWDVLGIIRKYKCNCVYCGVPLIFDKTRPNSFRLSFYTPLINGGKIHIDNLVISCRDCTEGYKTTNKVIHRIEGANTIPDLIHLLITKINQFNFLEEEQKPEYFKLKKEIEIIKRDLNVAFEELVMNLRYQRVKDILVEDPTWLVEGENDFGEEVAILAAEADNEEAKENLEKIVDTVIKTKKYKVVRFK